MTVPSTTGDAHLQAAVAAEFASLADLLAVASDARWDFGTVIDGRHLQATDLDWSHGSGPGMRSRAVTGLDEAAAHPLHGCPGLRNDRRFPAFVSARASLSVRWLA